MLTVTIILRLHWLWCLWLHNGAEQKFCILSCRLGLLCYDILCREFHSASGGIQELQFGFCAAAILDNLAVPIAQFRLCLLLLLLLDVTRSCK